MELRQPDSRALCSLYYYLGRINEELRGNGIVRGDSSMWRYTLVRFELAPKERKSQGMYREFRLSKN